MANYLDNDGLLYFWQKIKNLFAGKDEAVKTISRSGTTFTATRADGTTFTFTQQDNTVAKTTTTPAMNGTAAIGSETKYAAGDHVHPTDTSRAPLASPALTGTPTAPTAAASTDSTQIATTAFVHDVIDGLDTGVTSVAGKTGAVTLVKDDISDLANATTSEAGLMSTGDKTKLNGIATGAEVNQNAFSNVKVGSSTVAADSKTDTLELVAGSNVTLTPDTTNDKVTIAATDTTYSNATTSAAGLMSSSDKTKLNGIEIGAEVNQSAFSNVKVGSTTIAADAETDTLELVAGANVTLTPDATNDRVTIAARDTTYTGTQIVNMLGTLPVHRATADASGNNISDTYAKKTDIAAMYKYKGSVANESSLPSTGQTTGDVYNIEAASSYGGPGANVAWNGTAWDSLGEIFTITSITNAQIDTIVAS